MWQLDQRLREHDQPYEIGCGDECVPCERDRSLGRIVVAVVCTVIALAIAAVTK